MAIECLTCGAIGESNFSTNYFGELVCELCGTQSFLQSRNETQDMEDMGLDVNKLQTLKKQKKRKRQRQKKDNQMKEENANDTSGPYNQVRLVDCLLACQQILDALATSLIERQKFPSEYSKVVKEIWFEFLETWQEEGERPLLRCFTEFLLPRGKEENEMDPTITNTLLEEWNFNKQTEIELTFDAKVEQISQQTQQEELLHETQRAIELSQHLDQDITQDSEDLRVLQQDNMENIQTQMKEMEQIIQETQSQPHSQLQEQCDQTHHQNEAASIILTKRQERHRDRLKQLKNFTILDLMALLVLAARVLNLGVLPCDFVHWIRCGDLKYHQLLTLCTRSIQNRIVNVALFFSSGIAGQKISTSALNIHVHYLQKHMKILLPPLNVSLIAYNLCLTMGFPSKVFRNFQWLVGHCNNVLNTEAKCLDGLYLAEDFEDDIQDQEESFISHRPRLVESAVGIVAYLMVAIRLCPNWYEWAFERHKDKDGYSSFIPPYSFKDAKQMLRRDLGRFVDLCEDILGKQEEVPHIFKKHVQDLQEKYGKEKKSELSEMYQMSSLCGYPVQYDINGKSFETEEEIIQRIEKFKRKREKEQTNTIKKEKSPRKSSTKDEKKKEKQQLQQQQQQQEEEK
jgi:hypothetical protein